ncbi:TPA: hypothetical protein ACOXWE_004581 [Salmonella enterica]
MSISPRLAAGFRQSVLALLLAAALPAAADTVRAEPTIDEATQEIVAGYLANRCGAAFGEARSNAAPLDHDDRMTWLRCLWLRDSQAQISRGISPDRTLSAWQARNGITDSTPDAQLADAWRYPHTTLPAAAADTTDSQVPKLNGIARLRDAGLSLSDAVAWCNANFKTLKADARLSVQQRVDLQDCLYARYVSGQRKKDEGVMVSSFWEDVTRLDERATDGQLVFAWLHPQAIRTVP